MRAPRIQLLDRLRPRLPGKLAVLALATTIGCGDGPDGAPEAPAVVRVMISPGFEAAYDRLLPRFEEAEGVMVTTARGPSAGSAADAIPARLARGEAADVVILASAAMDALVAEGRVVAESRVELGRTGVGAAVSEGAPIPDIGTLDALRAALEAAGTVAHSAGPSGVYLTTEVFPRLGLVEEVAAKSVVTSDVAEAVARGDAEIGFQQISELVGIDGVRLVGPLPVEVQLETDYAAGVVADAASPELAARLIAFLASAEVDDVARAMGIER